MPQKRLAYSVVIFSVVCAVYFFNVDDDKPVVQSQPSLSHIKNSQSVNIASMATSDSASKQQKVFERRYAITFENTTRANLSGAISEQVNQRQDQLIEVFLDADLIISTFRNKRTNKTNAWARVITKNLRVWLNEQETFEFTKQINERLKNGVLVSFTQEGVIKNISNTSNSRAAKIKLLEPIIYLQHITLPHNNEQSPSPPQWRAREKDYNGWYDATYRIVNEKASIPSSTDQLQAFSKSIGQYSQFEYQTHKQATSQEAIPSVQFAGNGKINMRSQQVISYHAQEQRKHHLHGKTVAIVDNDLSLQLSSSEQLNDVEVQALLQTVATHFNNDTLNQNAAISNMGDKTQWYKELLGSARYSDLKSLFYQLEDLEGLEKKQALIDLYLKLQALAYLHPDQLEYFEQDLIAGQAQGMWFNLLARSLSLAGSEPAQRVLVNTLENRFNETAIARTLVTTLGFVDQPSLASETSLRSLITEGENPLIVQNAKLSLGVMANRLSTQQDDADAVSATDRARADQIVHETVSSLNNAISDREAQQSLSILGNIGSQETLTAIQPYTEHDSTELRKSAVFALRHIAGDESAHLIRNSLLNDKDLPVRHTAAQTLKYQDLTAETLATFELALEQEADTSIKNQLLASLSSHNDVRASALLQKYVGQK